MTIAEINHLTIMTMLLIIAVILVFWIIKRFLKAVKETLNELKN